MVEMMARYATFFDNVLQGPGIGAMHAFMLDHREREGKWPTFWRVICVLNKKDIEADEWDLRIAYFKIKESET